MSRTPNARNWTGVDPTAPITAEPTPTAGLGMLLQADLIPVDVAVLPYVGCGRLFDGVSDASRHSRFFGLRVAPAAAHARAAFNAAQLPYGSGSVDNHTSWTQTGGASGADVVVTHPVFQVTADFVWAFGGSSSPVLTTADTVNDTPSAPMDRQYELQTLGHPYTEPMMFERAGSLAVYVSERLGDLESL